MARAFIAEHDPTAAERAARSLIQGIERLVRHPRLGKRVDIAPDQIAPEEFPHLLAYLMAQRPPAK